MQCLYQAGHLQSSTKVLAHLAISVKEFISSSPSPSAMLFIVMRLSLLVYSIVGGNGVAYSSYTIKYCPQHTLSTYLRAICVPRTFDVDCSSGTMQDASFFEFILRARVQALRILYSSFLRLFHPLVQIHFVC